MTGRTIDDHSPSGGTTPRRVESQRVMRNLDFVMFGLLACFNVAAVVYFLEYWTSLRIWASAPVTFGLVTLLLFASVANYAGRWLMLPLMRRPIPLEPHWRPRVGVATTFVPGAEDLGMLERSVRAMIAMAYAHDTWVLDEGNDPQVDELCRQLGARHFTRKDMPQYQAEQGRYRSRTKYGNINAWLSAHAFALYDVVTLFDPDHIAHPAFLTRILGYFEDPGVGYVQAPQAYYNQSASFISRGAAEETYAYNSSIQMAAFGMGYPVIVGCHNSHRVSALEEAGGLAPHDADDLLTTLVYRSLGWRGVFVPEILARGLTPVDWTGYLDQQRRWARSVVDIKLRFQSRLAAGLAPATRIMSLLQGVNYLYRSFVLFGSFLVLAFALATGFGSVVIERLLSPQLAGVWAVLLVTDLFRQRFYLDRVTERGFHWRVAVLHFAKWPYTLLALLDVLRRRRLAYTITPKSASTGRRHGLGVPHLVSVGIIVGAWVAGVLVGIKLPLSIHAAAAVVVIGSLGIALSSRISFPAAYDSELAATRSGQA